MGFILNTNVSGGYRIARSLRFRTAASIGLTRTPSSTTDTKTWTYSAWVKRGILGADQTLIGARTASNPLFIFRFDASNSLGIFAINSGGTTIAQYITTGVFRDPSAWYHVVLKWDALNSAMSIEVNGVVQSLTTTTAISNVAYAINDSTVQMGVGVHTFAATEYLDGYLAQVHFIDGQALSASSFGETDAVTGVWKPKSYVGTYGTNGFYLDFSDNSGTTSTTIGADRSGNGNNWTPANVSVTAGVTNDSLVDTPTNYGNDTGIGGEVRGNYCTLNPLDNGGLTLSEANLKAAGAAGATWKSVRGTQFNSSYLEYWEATPTTLTTEDEVMFGWANNAAALTGASSTGTYAIQFTVANSNISKRTNGSSATLTTTGNLAANDIMMFARNPTTGDAWVGKNGAWWDAGAGVGNPAAGTNPTFTGLTGDFAPFISCYDTGETVVLNAGQRAFAYTAPSGFKALCTQNLSTPTIVKPSQYFNTVLYTGNGTDGRALTGFGHQPDLVWNKTRSVANGNILHDSVRGVSVRLVTNTTAAELSTGQALVSFDSDGITIDDDASNADLNGNTETHVVWSWKKGVTPGFDIVGFTSSAAAVSHSLGVKPGMIIVKDRTVASTNWPTTHKSLGANMQDNVILLNLTNANSASAGVWGGEPTTTEFFCGTGISPSGRSMIAYLFAEVAGFSKFGSYATNASADGPFVNLGFRPRWVMFKRIDSTGNWSIIDTTRYTSNAQGAVLWSDLADAEANSLVIDFVSNGFKLRSAGSSLNAAGTLIYAAFAEHPFKYARAR